MAFGKKCGSNGARANEEYGMGLVRSTSFGRKRISLSNLSIEDDCVATSPSKRQCIQDSFLFAEKSSLEDLPQEILIRIVCGVEHDDLKRLFFVSKAVREAALVAKQTHFAYSTPRKTLGFKNIEPFGDSDDDVQVPNAPKQSRVPRSRLSAKKMADISVALFASGDDDEGWPQRDLCDEMETED